jgi:NAD(P)-dependent dehydrogenase (short-subunit alcohol dehydrogenase family)
MKLEHRRMLVTGGGSGIGRAIAQRFTEEGAKVAILDRDMAGALETARLCGANPIEADVANEDSVNKAVEQAAAAMGGIDGVVNAAGVGYTASFKKTDFANWKRVLGINLDGPFLVCHAALPWLKEAGKATIVNIASGAALQPYPGASAYAASKAGLVNLNRVLAKELAPKIRGNVICPGPIDTPMLAGRGNLGVKEGSRDPAIIDNMMKLIGLQRKGKPEEIANVVLFLSCDESSFMTGSNLVVDGGRIYY